jgi:hypothetical protein
MPRIESQTFSSSSRYEFAGATAAKQMSTPLGTDDLICEDALRLAARKRIAFTR